MTRISGTWLLWVALTAVACGSAESARDDGSSTDESSALGCAPVDGTMGLPRKPPAPEGRFGEFDPPVDAAVVDAGALQARRIPSHLGGLKATGQHIGNSDLSQEILVYYGAASRDTSLSAFYADGGVQLNVVPMEVAITPTELDVLAPGRFVSVAVATTEGEMGWGDPDELGNRQFNIMWNDADTSWWISSAIEPRDLIGFARDIACGPSRR